MWIPFGLVYCKTYCSLFKLQQANGRNLNLITYFGMNLYMTKKAYMEFLPFAKQIYSEKPVLHTDGTQSVSECAGEYDSLHFW